MFPVAAKVYEKILVLLTIEMLFMTNKMFPVAAVVDYYSLPRNEHALL